MALNVSGCSSILRAIGELPTASAIEVEPQVTVPAASSAGSACSTKSSCHVVPDLVVTMHKTNPISVENLLSVENKREGTLSPPSCKSEQELKEAHVYDVVEIINGATCNGESSAQTCHHTVWISLIIKYYVKADVSY